MKHIMPLIAMAAVALTVHARSYDLRLMQSDETSEGAGLIFNHKTMARVYRLKLGGTSKSEGYDPIDIVAATIIRNIKTGNRAINDVATYTYTPTNRSEVFIITSGRTLRVDDNWQGTLGDWSRGYNVDGIIVEVYRKGKCLKHLAIASDPKMRKRKLRPTPQCAYLDAEGNQDLSERFSNATIIALASASE